MGNVADEAMLIRELLQQYLPELAGGGAAVVTAEQIATALAAFAGALGIRASPAGQAAGLYVPQLVDDTLPAVKVAGAPISYETPLLHVLGTNGGTAVLIDHPNGQPLYVRGASFIEAISVQNDDGPGVSVSNSGAHAALFANSQGEPGGANPAAALSILATDNHGAQLVSNTHIGATIRGATTPLVVETTREDETTPAAVELVRGSAFGLVAGDGLETRWRANGLSGYLARQVVRLASAAASGTSEQQFYVRRQGVDRLAATLDGNSSATETALSLDVNGVQQRVKVSGGLLYYGDSPPAVGGGPSSTAWADVTGKPDTLSGYGITDAQPLSAQLSALAGISGAPYGRQLVALASAAALRAAAGISGAHPGEHGLIGWAYDPVFAINGVNLVSGQIQLIRVTPTTTGPAAGILVDVATAGSGLTAGQNLAALYDASGQRLAITGDLSGVWNSNGTKTLSFTSPASVTAGVPVLAALLSVGTTTPQLRRAATNERINNLNLAAGAPRFAQSAAGQTSLPATITISGYSFSQLSLFAGLL